MDSRVLNEFEQMVFRGLQARDREIAREVLAPFQADFRRVLSALERSHDLDEGAIGTTHVLDLDHMTIFPKDGVE